MTFSIGDIKCYGFLVIYYLYAKKLYMGIDLFAIIVNSCTINYTKLITLN